MATSHVAGWTSNSPTPAQLKEFFAQIASGRITASRLQAFLRGRAAEHLIDLDVAPFCPQGWEVVEYQKGGQFEWEPAKVGLYLSPEQEDGRVIRGDKLREHLKGQPVFNANLLDYFLKNPTLIPEDWKGKYVFFWGTIYRDSGGDLCVRCLHLYGRRWNWGDRWLDHDWNSNNPAAVSATHFVSLLKIFRRVLFKQLTIPTA